MRALSEVASRGHRLFSHRTTRFTQRRSLTYHFQTLASHRPACIRWLRGVVSRSRSECMFEHVDEPPNSASEEYQQEPGQLRVRVHKRPQVQVPDCNDQGRKDQPHAEEMQREDGLWRDLHTVSPRTIWTRKYGMYAAMYARAVITTARSVRVTSHRLRRPISPVTL